MKRYSLTVATVLTLAGCTASFAVVYDSPRAFAQPIFERSMVLKSILDVAEEQAATKQQQQSEHLEVLEKVVVQKQLDSNKLIVNGAIEALQPHVGNTRYVYSGSTPSGWDCSGLVMWTYKQMGIELPHSATAQGNLGTTVTEPQIGDVVVFGYPGRTDWYHSAVYIGDGKAIHAGFSKGKLTEEIEIYGPYFAGHRVEFRRFLD